MPSILTIAPRGLLFQSSTLVDQLAEPRTSSAGIFLLQVGSSVPRQRFWIADSSRWASTTPLTCSALSLVAGSRSSPSRSTRAPPSSYGRSSSRRPMTARFSPAARFDSRTSASTAENVAHDPDRDSGGKYHLSFSNTFET